MKKIIFSLIVAVTVLFLASCKKDSSVTSGKTYVRVLEVSDDGTTVTDASNVVVVYTK